MLGSGQKVEFILAWQTYRVGDVIDPPATHRDWLLRNGYVKPWKPPLPDKKGAVRDKTKVVEQAKGGLFTR